MRGTDSRGGADGPARPPDGGGGEGGGGGHGILPLRLATLGLALVVAAMAAGRLTGPAGAPGGESDGGEPPATLPEGAPGAPVPPQRPDSTVEDTLREGESLSGLLLEHGVGPGTAALLVELVRPYANPRALRPGARVVLSGSAVRFPSRIAVVPDPDRTVRLRSVGARWTAALDSVPVRRDTVRVTGRVETNLYAAELTGDADALGPRDHAEVVHRLSRIFAWQIDFWRDVRPGDEYRVALERAVRPDGSLRGFRVLAAEYRSGSGSRRAIRFRPEGGEAAFFDEHGASLQASFLRSPLDFVRITSRFDRRRYHPVLQRRRPHLGVDYGAPTGTPVRATGAGRVVRAGWWGGYGRVVELRHAGGIRTRYAHLSRIEVRRGEPVEQGSVVGRVGSTGLSTAPHLHYEFLENGRAVDPGRIELPAATEVAAADRERFRRVRDSALALLPAARDSLPALARTAEAAGRSGD